MDGFFRRGGVWWARLVVPARLRAQVGRREFVQSTGTHDVSVGKLVASALLAGWRRQLFEWERGKLDNQKLLRLVEGSHALGNTAYVSVRDASAAVGLDRIALLSLASSGRLELYCQIGTAVRGHVLPRALLEPIDAALGVHGGLVVPHPEQMPEVAMEAGFPGQTLRIVDFQDLAGVALADGLDDVEVLLLGAPTPLGWAFAPNMLMSVAIDKVFEDRSSGKDIHRPQLTACLEHLRDGDTLHVHSMDRLARNVDDLCRMIKDLTARGVIVRFHKEGLGFTGEDSPMANLLLSMLGAVAEFERALILERQREGIAVAKAQGVYKGRKPSLSPERADQLRARAAAGENRSNLVKEFQVSRDTLYAYIRQPASD